MVRTQNEAAARVQSVTGRAQGYMSSVGCDAIAFGGDANDFVGVDHKHAATAAGTCAIRSSATKAGPARRAASD